MTNICLRQIQKLGAFAIFVTSLTLANAAQAISFTSTSGTNNIPDNDPVTGVSVTINIATPALIDSFNSITISGFTHPAYGDLQAFLIHGATTVQLFQSTSDGATFTDPTIGLVIGGGNYTFTFPSGNDWYSQTTVVPDNVNYVSFDDLNIFNAQALEGDWTLNVRDTSSTNSVIGSFTQFSFDVNYTPVPFEFEPSIGLSILGGAWLLRRHLKKNETKV